MTMKNSMGRAAAAGPPQASGDRPWAEGGRYALSPNPEATFLFLAGLAATWFAIDGETPSALTRHAAYGVALSIAAMLAVELRKGWTAILRADTVCMAALYYLLFAEFLVDQPTFDAIVRDQAVVEGAIGVAMVGMGAMSVGRHLAGGARRWPQLDMPVPRKSLLVMFWVSMATGYFHMLMAVGFSPLAMLEGFLAPRFSVPWGRPQYGDLGALVYELGATIYLVPPLAGLILGRRSLYSKGAQAAVTAGLLLTLFYAFSTGTRNVMAAFLATFLVSFFYSSGSVRRAMPIAIASAVLMVISTVYGLEFRNIGLGAYVSEGGYEGGDVEFYVDYNLWTISEIMSVMPSVYPYVGLDMPIWLLARVIPRAFWPGKPTGESVAAETYLDTSPGTTLSSTFIGESYMAAGVLTVMLVGLAIGFLSMWWTRKTFSPTSDLAILFYGSGFFAVVITMRSVYMLPVAIMPVLALWVFTKVLIKRSARTFPR